MNTLQAFIIAIIEGLTEYLPISSTAHMIFTSSYFGIQEDDFVKLFQVSIQFGAILAVVALYWKKFLAFPTLKIGMNFYTKLAFARYMQNFLKVDMQNLYAIKHLLISAKVDNAFDMLALTKQLLPMLDEVIAQADPDNYELEIIK